MGLNNADNKYKTYMGFKAEGTVEANTRQKNLVDRLRRFLKELKKVYNINVAARNAGLGPETVYYYMGKNESFRLRVQEIRQNCRGRVEGSLYREALAGKAVPMIYFLKNNTDKYRELTRKDMLEAAKQVFLPWAPAQLPAPEAEPAIIEGESREVN